MNKSKNDIGLALRNYYEVLSSTEDVKLAEKDQPAKQENKTLAVRPARLKALLGNSKNGRTKNGTNPPRRAPGKGRMEKGWRDITVGDGINYGKKAWHLAKYLAQLVNVEDKKFDVDGSGGTVITTTPTVVNLSNIPEGSYFSERSGISILAQAMEFRASVAQNSADTGSFLRVMIVCDRENHGTDIVLGDVLEAGTDPIYQPIRAEAGNRFEILYDELFSGTNTVGLSTGGTNTTFVPTREFMPVLSRKWHKHIKYQAQPTADTSNWENALFLLAVSSAATNGPNLRYAFRLHFTDN